MKNQHVVLKHLDNPIRILSFSVSDLAAYIVPFFVGSLFDSIFLVPLGGLLTVFTLKRVHKRLPRFYFLRFWYWNLPAKSVNRMFKSFPASHKRYWAR